MMKRAQGALLGLAIGVATVALAAKGYSIFSPGGDLDPTTSTWNNQTIANGAINLSGAKVTGQLPLSTGVSGTLALGSQVSGQLPEGNGGTNQTTYTQGDLLYASAANTLAKLAKNTSATRYLANTGTSNAPVWAQVNLANGITGTLPATSVGAVPNWTNNTQNVAYQFVLTDAGKEVLHSNADSTARTYTVPQNSTVAFVIGTVIMLANDSATASADTIAQGTGATLVLGGSGATTGNRTLAQGGIAFITKVATNRWIVWGVGVT